MTADEPRVRVTTNLAFGICLILLGSVLILDRLQLVAASQLLRFWPIVFVLFGAVLVIQSFQRVDATAAEKRSAFRPSHIVFLVFLALFLTRGPERQVTARSATDTANVVAVMSHHQQVSSAAPFRGAEMTAIMGRADLDLRSATIAPGDAAEIEVFALMGGSTIRVPDGWTVEVRAVPVMGGFRDRRNRPDVPGAPRVIIRGFIMMGGLDIRS
jgi:hypothetical protein